MCEKDDLDEMYEISRSRDLSRRQFGALSLGVGLTALLPRLADAADTTESEVQIKTPDGTCDAYLVHPVKGKYPAVLIWPDIFGLRPAFRQMGKRLAESWLHRARDQSFLSNPESPDRPRTSGFQRSGDASGADESRGYLVAGNRAHRCDRICRLS